jgi:large subunit ribosomal protein L21
VKTGAAAAGTIVKGTITEHDREAKTIVFKFKRKKQYRRTQGHRQNYTRVQINEIV